MVFTTEEFSEVVYRKLAWVGFEPMTTEFRSDALTDWAIRPWVQLALRANFVQLLQFHLFVQCSRFISAIAFVSRHICFKRNLAQVITLAAEWIDTYGIHHWRILRSSYRKLAQVGFEPTTTEFRSGSNRPSYQAMSSTQPTLYSYSNFIYLFSVHISFRQLASSVATFALRETSHS